MNGIRLSLRTNATGDDRITIDAAMHTSFPEDQDGLVWLNGSTDTKALTEQVARVVWAAYGGYCQLAIEIDWSESMPDGGTESVIFGRQEYARLLHDPDGEEAVVSEHWADLDDATIAAGRALAEMSKLYPFTAFELTVIGCEEYPYISVGKPRRADPPVARIRVYRGGFQDSFDQEWPEIRAGIEQAKKGQDQ